MACSSPSTREDPKHPDYYKKALHNPRNTDIEDIYKRLVEAASLETKQRKAPCKYLGVQTKGTFEPDPGKWPSRSYPGRKTHATVYFEWEHVLCEGAPHRCPVSIDNLLHHQRAMPNNPLRQTACSN